MDRTKIFMGAYKGVYVNHANKKIIGGFGIEALQKLTDYISPKNDIRKKAFGTNEKTEAIIPCVGEAVSCCATMFGEKLFQKIMQLPNKKGVVIHATIPSKFQPTFQEITEFQCRAENDRYSITCLDKDGGKIIAGQPHEKKARMTAIILTILVNDLVNKTEDIPTDMVDYAINHDYTEGFKDQYSAEGRLAYIKTCVDFYHMHKSIAYEDESDVFAPSLEHGREITQSVQKEFSPRIVRVMSTTVRPKRVARKSCYSDSDFPKEWAHLIPSIPDGYLIPEYAEKIAKGIMAGKVTCLLEGPAGTGKSTIVDIVANMVHAPVVAKINCTNALDEFVLGKFMPKEGTAGEIVFVQSEIADAIEKGGWTVFEEINMAQASKLAFLNSLLDGNKMVRLDNGKVIKRHPNFRLFATMNPGYAGTRELNASLRDRFNYDGIVTVPELPIPAIKHNLLTNFWLDERVINAMLTVYKKIKAYLQEEQEDVPISPRGLIGWATTIQEEFDYCDQSVFELAAEKNIIPLAGSNAPLAQALRELVNGVSVPTIAYPEAE